MVKETVSAGMARAMRIGTTSDTWALAGEAAQRGDPIETENCYQHAEHYFRVINNRA